MAKSKAKQPAETPKEPPVVAEPDVEVPVVVEPEVEVPEPEQPAEPVVDADIEALVALLDGYGGGGGTPENLRPVLAKVRRLQEFSTTVQLAMLMMNVRDFNMGDKPAE